MSELVSIVIPVYNAEKYLEKALDSCLNQSYSNIEVIAVNDGSTDNTSEILSGYADKIIVVNQKNKGIAGALNTGIRAMNSNWYKLMNADDILYPECVEILISELGKIRDKKIIIYGNYDIIDSNDDIIEQRIDLNRNSWSQFEQGVALLNSQFINCITTIFPKNIFEKYGYYNESSKFSEDYDLLLRLSLLHGFRFHLIEEKLAMYRNHPKQDTKRKMKETYNYSDYQRNSILKQLEISKRIKYEKDLKEFRKKEKIPFSTKIKSSARDFLFKSLPEPTAKKVRKIYRKFRYGSS